ncbi:hypothetical protein MMC07_000557 [Pseudocyphellaria aurata]|nr:hypothetical protein [Pseudocyphellaria aurata]
MNAGIDTDGNLLHQVGRSTSRPAMASKQNGVMDEFHERRPQTGVPFELCDIGSIHDRFDGNRSEHDRVNHHERMPRRIREKAPELSGLLQNERPGGQDSRVPIPCRNNQKRTTMEVGIDKDEDRLNAAYGLDRVGGPARSAAISPFIEFPPLSTVYDGDSETHARIRARLVEWQYRLDRNIEPLRNENPEVILAVYLLARDYQDMEEHDRPQYGMLTKAALGFLRSGSKPAGLENIVSALRRYCAEEEQRTDTNLRACLAPMLCNKGVLKKLWYRDDYIELMTGPESASSMAALLQVALLDSL